MSQSKKKSSKKKKEEQTLQAPHVAPQQTSTRLESLPQPEPTIRPEETGPTGEEPMSEKKDGFKWQGLNVGLEMFNQFARPWSEAVQSQMEQVQQLQTNLMEHTQKAIQETQNMTMEGFKHFTNTVQRFHEVAQEQVQRFTQRK